MTRSMQFALALLFLGFCSFASFAQLTPGPLQIPPDEQPMQKMAPEIRPSLVESSSFIRAEEARRQYNVTGAGLTVAVLDTGIRPSHIDFKPAAPTVSKIVAQVNYTANNAGNVADAKDGHGHGTNVAGIIAANGDHKGIAYNANIAVLKVLANDGGGDFADIESGLQWVIDNQSLYKISVVNMSLGDSRNYLCDDGFSTHGITAKIRQLRSIGIPVVIAAGNEYWSWQSNPGMAFPGIVSDAISVGALYDADIGGFEYVNGAKANSTGPGRITPFSQRLPVSLQSACQTDVFAPGAPITSAGILNDNGESIQHGTSQAAPITSGVILLMQEFYRRASGGRLPSVAEIEAALRSGSMPTVDGDDENDNVVHRRESYRQLDAVSAMTALQRAFTANTFRELRKLQANVAPLQ